MTNLFIKIGVFLLLVGALWFYVKKTKDLEASLLSSNQTVKSYEVGLQSYKDKYGTLHYTSLIQQRAIDDLQASKDSVTSAMLDSVDKYKIKLKNVQDLGRVDTKIEIKTVREFKYRDTTLDFSEPPHILETVKIDSGKATRDLGIYNTQSLIWHKHQETKKGKAPSKIFFIRWFQSLHDVHEVDIVNSNPFIETTNQRFIHVDED